MSHRGSLVEEIRRAALARPAGERPGYLVERCGADSELRAAVEALLSTEEPTASGEDRAGDTDKVAPGTNLGVYRIEAIAGSGGMGSVYRAVDTRLNRPVAIKFLSMALLDEANRRRFQREAQLASSLNHPHILTVHDIGEHRGRQYLVTEFVEGGTLSEWRRRTDGHDWQQVVEMLVDVADALATAHEANILHRDIKPENILIGGGGHAKLADFGLAKTVAEQSGAAGSLTRSGAVIGTVCYMSPEQALGRTLDARSDIFSFGVVLYEQLAGHRPFEGNSDLEILNALVKEPAAPLSETIAASLRAIVDKTLEKDPRDRYQSMREIAVDLRRALRASAIPAGPAVTAATTEGTVARTHSPRAGPTVLSEPLAAPSRRLPLRSIVSLAIATAVLAGMYAAYGMWERSGQVRAAREGAVPEIERLTNAGDLQAAFDLAARTRELLPDDPLLDRLTPLFTGRYTVTSTPPGAEVYVRAYDGVDDDWQLLGSTPLANIDVPRRMLRWRIEMPGFDPFEYASADMDDVLPDELGQFDRIDATLQAAGPDSDLVLVPAGSASLGRLPPVMLDAFRIERYEVRNAAWQAFVDAGGYARSDLWEGLRIERNGTALGFEEAMALFVDSTGRPGPAGWELGRYKTGEDRFPVTGISWYEAMAYARFRGRTLPTIYHRLHATLPPAEAGRGFASAIVPLSNFAGGGPAEVGSFQGMSPFGAYDMFGNVGEWALNHDRSGAWVMGGDWTEPEYNFFVTTKRSLLERSDRIGLRLMQSAVEPPAETLVADDRLVGFGRDASQSVSAGDEVYAAYASLYSYRSGDLRASAPATLASTPEWTRERISIDAGYGGERLDVNLFIPQGVSPPYQALVYFPGADAVFFPRSQDEMLPGYGGLLDFVWKSGRVLVFPVWQGTFERFRAPWDPNDAVRAQREWVERRWDLGRTVDYLTARDDIDPDRIAYVGISFGASYALPLFALEPRLRTAILIGGGLPEPMPLASYDAIHFIPRISRPVLMVNGRFDPVFPPDSMQRPLFDGLGTAPADKRAAISDAGHVVPRSDVLREAVAWLDRYFGAVR